MADGSVRIDTRLETKEIEKQINELKELLQTLEGAVVLEPLKIDMSTIESTLKSVDTNFKEFFELIKSGMVNATDSAKKSLEQMGEVVVRTLIPASKSVAEHMGDIQTEGIVEITKNAKQAETGIKTLEDKIARLSTRIANIDELDLSAKEAEKQVASWQKQIEVATIDLARL